MKPSRREIIAAVLAALAAVGVSLGVLEEGEGSDLAECTTSALDGAGEVWATQACEDIATRLVESMRAELGDVWVLEQLPPPGEEEGEDLAPEEEEEGQ